MNKRYLILMLTRVGSIIIMLNLISTPSLYAESIVVDGNVVESEWALFYKDEIYSPVYSLFTASDLDNIYIGIIIEGDTDPADFVVEFAFRAEKYDFWIQFKDGIMKYRPSGGTWEGWWAGVRNADLLPIDGFTIIAGETNGETSYEICISKDLMGEYADDFPEKLKICLKIETGEETNIYPEIYADWWFQVEQEEDTGPEFIEPEQPRFHVPETPYGTVLTLVTMAAALAIMSKKPVIK